MPHTTINQSLEQINIVKLKGVKNVAISFANKRITGIFGVNGSGKSTILHIIDCMYRNLNSEYRTNMFTKYFKRVGNSNWEGSDFTAKFIISGTEKFVRYYKGDDRWKPRKDNRPKRDCVFIGIESCVPCIERETPTHTSYSMTDIALHSVHIDDIIRDAANILNKPYDSFGKVECASRKYSKVHTASGDDYTSLSMGAGEQKLFYILETLYSIPDYSIVLIDELDLTMHTMALNRLMDRMVAIAEQKKIQIVFTSHREELALRKDINVRHLWKPANQDDTICLEQTTPDCLYRLNGKIEHENVVFVEDIFAESIVRDLIRKHKLQKYIKVIRFGDAANAFSLATGLYLQGILSDKQLILTDGDVYRTDEERLSIMKKRFSGREPDKAAKRTEVLTHIKQFNLPAGEHPEHFVWTILKTKQGDLADIANSIDQTLSDKHKFLDDIFEQYADTYEAFMNELLNEVRDDARWESYTEAINEWLVDKKRELGV